MIRKAFTIGLSLLLVSASAKLAAHHSFAAEFIQEEATIDGVVTEVWFKNPHVRYYVEVTMEDGSKETWDTRGQSPTALRRSGNWRVNTIKVGDHVVMEGYLGRDGRKLLSIRKVTLDDGTVLPERVVQEAGAYPSDPPKDP
jgi:hypothetical protein